MEEVGQDTIIFHQIDTVHEYEDLSQLIENRANMNDMCKALNISQYKQVDNEYYIIVKTTEKSFRICFDSEGEYMFTITINFSPIANKEALSNLKEGARLEDVMEADPEGDYPFLYASWTLYPRYSYHYFEDGSGFHFCCEQDEDGNYVVYKIVYFTI